MEEGFDEEGTIDALDGTRDTMLGLGVSELGIIVAVEGVGCGLTVKLGS